MHNIEILSNGYTGDLRNSKVKDLPLSYALYFMPEHLPKPLFILSEFRDRFSQLNSNIQAIYDLGCGTGTGTIAYKIVFNDDIPVVLTDINMEMLNLASRILSKMQFSNFELLHKNYLRDLKLNDKPSLFILMNTLSENQKQYENIKYFIKKILTNTIETTIIIIEPITDSGIKITSSLRKEYSNFVIMPCPSTGSCPMANERDKICRFNLPNSISTTLEPIITARHKSAKFTYLVLSNVLHPQEENLFRVLNGPIKRNFGYELAVCNQKSIHRLKIRTGNNLEKNRIRSLVANDLIKISKPDHSLLSPFNSEQIEIIFKNTV